MTAATQDLLNHQRTDDVRSGGVAAGAEIFSGTIICLNTDDYAAPAADTAGYVFLGYVQEAVDNGAGNDGDETVEYVTHGLFKFTIAAASDGDIGKTVYVMDDNTVGLADEVTNYIPVGIIAEIEDATHVWVELLRDGGRIAPIGQFRQWTIEAAGVNATAFDFSAQAAGFGGSGFHVASVQSVRAIVTSTNAPATPYRRVVTTDWTLAAGVLSAANDETANTWEITFWGFLT